MPQPYHEILSGANVPQSQPLNPRQVLNAAGGYVYQISKWDQLDRFLMLGTVGGTYYIDERKLTQQNLGAIEECIKEDGIRVVQRAAAISLAGRAPKNDPAIFILALACIKGSPEVRREALAATSAVCRIPTHLFTFMTYYNGLGGKSNSSVRRAIARWYTSRDEMELAYQLTKYQARDGMANYDLLNFSHPKPKTATQAALFGRVVSNKDSMIPERDDVVKYLRAVDDLQLEDLSITGKAVTIALAKLPREVVPTELLNEPAIWEALLPHMPLNALVRNLGKMTSVGLLQPGSAATAIVLDRLSNDVSITKSRLHPISVLMALKTYQQGHGIKGSLSWKPVGQIEQALSQAIYLCYRNVEPSNKRVLFALDISGSMTMTIGGYLMSCFEAGAALMTVIGNTEPASQTVMFDTGWYDITVNGRRIDDVLREVVNRNHGGTDFVQALNAARRSDYDQVVVFTDSETWAGQMHGDVALRDYTQRVGHPVAVTVVSAAANLHSAVDPDDPQVLNIVGFDASVPEIIRSR